MKNHIFSASRFFACIPPTGGGYTTAQFRVAGKNSRHGKGETAMTLRGKSSVLIIVTACGVVAAIKAQSQACPHIPCEPGDACMYDPVVDQTTCYYSANPSVGCTCEIDDKCTPWIRIDPARTDLAQAIEDGTPPGCSWDGPCYQCFLLIERVCLLDYRCLNQNLGYPCGGSFGSCLPRLYQIHYAEGLIPLEKDCCYWAA